MPTKNRYADPDPATHSAVIKGAIPRDRADAYADQMYGWLEGL